MELGISIRTAMPNPGGKNGYGEKNYPPDDVLRDSLKKYLKSGLSVEGQLQSLRKDHSLSIGKSKLALIKTRLKLPSVRKPPSEDVAETLVLQEVLKGGEHGTAGIGPNAIRVFLRKQTDEGENADPVLIPRDTIRKIMLKHFPEGFDQRFPGKTRPSIPRKTLTSVGPWREVSGDGHEKLSQQALDMGPVGLPIYGLKDKWSSHILKLVCIPDCRSAVAIAHLQLDLAEEHMCIPVQMTTDKGAETSVAYAIQGALRACFAPDIDEDTHPSHVLLKSTHHTVIEGLWPHLLKKTGKNLRDIVTQGKRDHIFIPTLWYHVELFNWIFPKLVQNALDNFREYWNGHRIRKQKDKAMPSGHIPERIFMHPDLESPPGIDCRIIVTADAISDLRKYLDEAYETRESCLRWSMPQFDTLATNITVQLGLPSITLDNAWEAFSAIAVEIGRLGIRPY